MAVASCSQVVPAALTGLESSFLSNEPAPTMSTVLLPALRSRLPPDSTLIATWLNNADSSTTQLSSFKQPPFCTTIVGSSVGVVKTAPLMPTGQALTVRAGEQPRMTTP